MANRTYKQEASIMHIHAIPYHITHIQRHCGNCISIAVQVYILCGNVVQLVVSAQPVARRWTANIHTCTYTPYHTTSHTYNVTGGCICFAVKVYILHGNEKWSAHSLHTCHTHIPHTYYYYIICHRLAIIVFIGKLPATGGWVRVTMR